ncbi:MAG: glycoside hydrolase family 31 protein [Bacteroidales bacterium]|nr:glycoside hydrolase family 31 protein [Bacteroidales bacterium]
MKSMNRNPKRALASALLILFTFTGFTAIPEDIGRIIHWHKTGTGLEGKTERAFFNIQVCNKHIIRVRVSQKETMSNFSYLLDPEYKPQKTGFSVSRAGNKLIVSTDSLTAEIEMEPSFRIIFKDTGGNVINEDSGGKGFGYSFNGNRTNLYKKLQPGERFTGLGEVLGNLDKRGSAFTLNNTDTYKYGDPRLPMYTNVPFYIGIHSNQVYGLFYHNTYKTFFNFGVSTPEFASITGDGGDIDYFFIYDNSIAGILRNYSLLTGRMPLPPLWSLGYHQSRCSYFPQNEVLDIAETFRTRKIPVDCIVLDADYLWEYEPFRINLKRFPDMPGLTAKLSKLGIEVTASVNPGIKIDSTYFAHNDGLKKDIFVKYADGSLYTAEIAPSLNNFVDFTNPLGRQWWADNMKFLPDNGIHGYWNDMNEPAVGASYLPDNLLFDFDGHKADALEAKNVYGMQMARSSYESALKYGEGRRPFILTRSGFAGVQRYAAVWTGDNTADDEFIPGGALLNTQMGLSGIPFTGDDIGGYIGTTSKELFIRWIETGVFQPFVRNHKESYAAANEPWAYGSEAEAIAREFIGFRYKLMPYIYSTFYETSNTGMPVVRSLCIDNPFNTQVYSLHYQYQFMLGEALMVVPVTTKEETRQLYLPPGLWYDVYNDRTYTGDSEISVKCPIYRIPVFVKASSVLPVQSLVQTTAEQPSDTLQIHIYKGSENNSFLLYEDDGLTFDYKEKHFRKQQIDYLAGENVVLFRKPEGSFQSRYKHHQLILHGFGAEISQVIVNGQTENLKISESAILNPLKALEPVYEATYYKLISSDQGIPEVKTVLMKNTNNEIRVELN